MRRVGIVGSRRYTDKDAVKALVRSLPADAIVVSGGCRGVDKWAVAAAAECGMASEEVLPELAGVESYAEACRAYRMRNERLAGMVDVLYAFVASDRRGGTEQTIRFAEGRGIPVVVAGIAETDVSRETSGDKKRKVL